MRILSVQPDTVPALASDAFRTAGGMVEMPCGGRRSCGNCLVWLRGALEEIGPAEAALLARREPEPPPLPGFVRRLACCCRLLGPAELLLPEDADEPATAAFAGQLPSYDGGEPDTLGAAIDVGTTTITLVLFRLGTGDLLATVSELNRQTAFGADVISRINAAQGPGGPLHDCLTAQLRSMLDQALNQAGESPDSMTRMVVTGNTTMLHFLRGLDPRGIGVVPFTPASLFGEEIPAQTLFPGIPGALYLPPCVSAYIGADITCGILAARLTEGGTVLLADVGTNGEMALFADGRLRCCAVAAGPAFEGAEISMGMPALPGAVDRVWDEGSQLGFHVLPGSKPRGICGTGLMSAVRTLLERGSLDETGRLEAREDDPCLLWNDSGPPAVWLGGSGVTLTQEDIRKLQLAKAAVAAGIDTLLSEAGLSPKKVETLWLAGGFGSFLRPEDAAGSGMLPLSLAERTRAAGNLALTGAALLLFSARPRETAAATAARAEEIPLATHPVFMEQFVERMGFFAED
ncbi:MAG: ASKHA domain-containing protein [Oscillospiraceae bacterium]|jgi:uncharacterized 2Fe-2S/4Fe-4S cluster protein (DUF4445 family)|nr:ASKHA domain-containing protein [Oscillospiraceae bacterium]